MIIAKANLNKNRRIAFENKGFLCGQKLGIIPSFRFGLFSMAYNGCGVIAAYNALLYLNKPKPLCEVIYFMERHKVFFGVFGWNPYALMKIRDFSETHSRRVKNYNELEGADAFIITSWNGKPFLSGSHTVFCTKDVNGAITVYNNYSRDSMPRKYKSFKEMIGDEVIISAYIITE
ncbi:MAG: hypothetical protein J6A30_05445 [Ruminococcus sp.]|nr:hypothetical protein [Ruminococcus sp.]MBO5383727.1 hypothetical protein [Ruminococcus sp.]